MNQSSGERTIQNQTFLRGHQPEEVPLLHAQQSRSLPLAASGPLSGQSLYFTEGGPRLTRGSDEEGVTLRCTADGTGDGVLTTRSFVAGETVMVGFLVGALKENDSHATQVGPGRWARHGGLGPKVNHSCDPNCGVRLNDEKAFDVVARQQIDAGQELTFDYAMRNFTIDYFPAVCLCGAPRCRGSVTGWKDLTAAQKAGYGDLVAPYLLTMDNEIRLAHSGTASTANSH
jgi:hypothetical protein